MHDMKGANALDRLELFGRSLRGSRKTIFNVIHKQYSKEGKLPEMAGECFGEVLANFEDEGYAESKLDRETRAIAGLEQLSKLPGTAWRAFYADWMKALSDFQDVGFERCARQLFIGFLNKFPQSERSKFMRSCIRRSHIMERSGSRRVGRRLPRWPGSTTRARRRPVTWRASR